MKAQLQKIASDHFDLLPDTAYHSGSDNSFNSFSDEPPFDLSSPHSSSFPYPAGFSSTLLSPCYEDSFYPYSSSADTSIGYLSPSLNMTSMADEEAHMARLSILESAAASDPIEESSADQSLLLGSSNSPISADIKLHSPPLPKTFASPSLGLDGDLLRLKYRRATISSISRPYHHNQTPPVDITLQSAEKSMATSDESGQSPKVTARKRSATISASVIRSPLAPKQSPYQRPQTNHCGNGGIFECPTSDCDKKFTKISNLNSHLRTHTGERPFRCTFEDCQARFGRNHDLKRHMRVHLGIKPYRCDICAKEFSRLDALNRHKRLDKDLACALLRSIQTFNAQTSADNAENEDENCGSTAELQFSKLIL